VDGGLSFGLVTTNQSWLSDELAALDASGFAALYVVDHPAFPIPDPWTWLAFAAARTSRVRLGTHVTGAPFHHPTALAKQVATVDRLSNGRAVLGIGAAYERADFEPYGFPMLPFRERLAALEEMLCILDSLWTRGATRFAGAHFALAGDASFEPKPVQQPRPPIVIGLNRQGQALHIAARRADAINTWQLGAGQVAALRPHVEQACECAGRDPASLRLTADVLLARGANRARASQLASALSAAARSWGRSRSVTEWDASGILYGDADGIAEQALRFSEIGVTELSVAIHGVDDLHWFDENVIAREPSWQRGSAPV
jgi:alkanesulfonate monooxygenase SsuD/methylene tetrahydromethanopterin reductase-like flavin-dependent oxidoreductase (luciferase family)